MSIRQIQTKNILNLITQAYFVDGVNPNTSDLYKMYSDFFADNPVGLPYRIPADSFRQQMRSNPELMNDLMASMIVNLDTLYEVTYEHIEQLFMIHTILRTNLDRLRIKRNKLEARIDDYLLGLFNADGYFYSFSDTFNDTEFSDLTFTTGFVDTVAGNVTLPAVSSATKLVNPDRFFEPQVTVTNKANLQLPFITLSPFRNAIDGLTNTAWQIEVRTNDPGPITVTVEIPMATALGPSRVTKIELVPFGVQPIQCGIVANYQPMVGTQYTKPFSNKVKTSADKMVFVGDQIEHNLNSIKLQLTKQDHDYFLSDANNRTKVYIFGFREIIMSEQHFDPTGIFICVPFGIPSDLQDEAVIDAVSLTVEDVIPTGTSITYYVAEDVPTATSIEDFNWQQIDPLSQVNETKNQIVRFNGATTYRKYIRLNPRNGSELQQIQLNTTSVDLSKRNPTPSYVQGESVYRITEFDTSFLPNTLSLEEGINSTKIYYTDYDEDAVAEGFAFWREVLDDPTAYLTVYGEIDTGHGFFYGADVGENEKSVFVETFLYCDSEKPVILKECMKSDPNSRTWDLRLFLNGREIASMPVGTDKVTVPWKFREGKNHIALLVNIPEGEGGMSPYIGTFAAMTGADLFDFGTVKLNDLQYVDNYKFENNETDTSNSFTIYNSEIVTRKKPTNNYRLTYSQPNAKSGETGREDQAPAAIRLRADLVRTTSNTAYTPVLDSYRLRFSYS